MRSWKTTVSGLAGSVAALVLLMSQSGVVLPKWVVITAGFVVAGGFASLGINAKDSNVSGPSKVEGGDIATK
jgi:hypothetical protein